MSTFVEPLNIIITGVGGQGNVLASQVVSVAAAVAGYRVVVGETFGVSQRGGSVMSHVRISKDKPYGPLIPRGRAGVIAGFEPLETLRVMVNYANPDTVTIMNDRPNYPLGCLLGEDKYPDPARIEETIRKLVARVHRLPATELAKEAGSPLAANMVMTGALAGSGLLPFGREYLTATIELLFKDSVRDLNLAAFELGYRQLAG
ncbi:indolepyruvate oxidoreductase subunit beta [Desulfoscipio gibsoniae]|uniref:2-oxoacid:ferredoxin oxidoreductase, gamma subunit n=1 Tax=Desulfoscipio gibsoniae DSM 7213 TaxID=767817 RepID=R4KF63_9FIRM|nr:indolepyruvate oxidoreductase subunit beta [Desulfoscipio gibsoniae]AGL00307.1 2-oxoacid:ferredoxin oxidoreductase, gamma subunit [Desulfoscipio gibsoniae DSM 7213]